MVASALFILDVKGKVLISRNYRGDIPTNAVDKFMPMVIEAEDSGSAEAAGPVLQGDNGLSYIYVQHNNLYRTLSLLFVCFFSGWEGRALFLSPCDDFFFFFLLTANPPLPLRRYFFQCSPSHAKTRT